MSNIIEKAKSGRAKCRTCGEKIEKGVYRFGEEVNTYDHPSFRYHHLECVAKINPVELDKVLNNTKEDISNKEELKALIVKSKKKFIYGESYDYPGKLRCYYCGERIHENLIIVQEEGSFTTERRETYIHVACARHAIDDDNIIETIKENKYKLKEKQMNEIIDILKNDKEDPMENPDYVQKSWPLVKKYLFSQHVYGFELDDGRYLKYFIRYSHPQELYELATDRIPIKVKGDILKEKEEFDHVIPFAFVAKCVSFDDDPRHDNADYWLFFDWRARSEKPSVLAIGTGLKGFKEMKFDSLEKLLATNLYSQDENETEETENIKKSLAFAEKWMGQGIARSGNYFFFLHPRELYDIAIGEYSDYLEDNWDFDNVIPVACIEQDFGHPKKQDLGHADYWVFLDWRENGNKPCIIVTGTDSWEYDEMVFNSIEELMGTKLYG